MQRPPTTSSSSSSFALDCEEQDAASNLLSKEVIDRDQEVAYVSYSPMPADDMQDMIAYYRTKKNTHWCYRPINFQLWFVVISLMLFCFGFYVYTQAVDFEIHHVSGTSEMHENQRIGALERGQRDLSAQIEAVQRAVGALQEAFHETNPNYIFEWKKKE